jgi:hypothetical protein
MKQPRGLGERRATVVACGGVSAPDALFVLLSHRGLLAHLSWLACPSPWSLHHHCERLAVSVLAGALGMRKLAMRPRDGAHGPGLLLRVGVYCALRFYFVHSARLASRDKPSERCG